MTNTAALCGVARGVSVRLHPHCGCQSSSCPVPPQPCCRSWLSSSLAHELTVFDSCCGVPAWCVTCSVHPPTPFRVGVVEPSPSCAFLRPLVVAPPAIQFFPRRNCLHQLLFCTCPPLCAGDLWPMPASVRRDVRFSSFFHKHMPLPLAKQVSALLWDHLFRACAGSAPAEC